MEAITFCRQLGRVSVSPAGLGAMQLPAASPRLDDAAREVSAARGPGADLAMLTNARRSELQSRGGVGPRSAWRELFLVAGIYELYSLSRRLGAGRPVTALTNAQHLLRTERWAHLAPESWLNHVVTVRPALAIPADYAYATLHFAVTPVVLIWLWRTRPDGYVSARRTLTAATLLGLVGFAAFPLAPPRMLPGFADTMAQFGHYGWWGSAASAPKGLAGLTNQYAAMPSLHVGWALWCAWQVTKHARRRTMRLLAITYPVVVVLVVISTANHYLADAVAGFVVLVLGHVVSTHTAQLVRSIPRAALRA